MSDLAMNTREHAISFILPISVMILLPWLLMWLTGDSSIGWSLPWFLNLLAMSIGMAILLAGVIMLVVCIRMFAETGRGTLAP